ncbi:MarR family winged helix-turn-helix transcriptional regulator [Ruegeria sp. 6PALISEP08]|uniref:MarR family winged helix-turn-helix transcriptional regulator n=1 Tax=Ruegeria sp. 6PALISEP08 TaxID=1225660 RepID=UPI003528143E
MLRTEWRVLFHLGLFGEMTAKDIGERAKMHKTKISRAVAKLEQRRYLKRTRDEADRRAEWLALTPAGQTVYRDLRNVAANYDARLSSLFNEEEAALLRHMLQRLAGLD